MSTSSPRAVPTQVFARLEGSSEPCTQSWNTTKVRTKNPAVGATSATTSKGETLSARYIARHSARYAPAEVAMSSNPRPARGWV